MNKPLVRKIRTPRRWQALLKGLGGLPFALRMLALTDSYAQDEHLPSLSPGDNSPALVQTLGGGAFRAPSEIAFGRMSPDGSEIFTAHQNQARISILDAKTGRLKEQI